MSKRIPHWKRSTVFLPTVGPSYELAEFSVNMNKGFPGLPAEYETCLAGRHGEIWQSGPSQFKAVITSVKQARKLAAALGQTINCQKGDEPIITFHEKYLLVALEHIKIPQSPGTRVKLANEFGKQS